MSKEGDIHAALMAQVEALTGYDILWPQKGGDVPPGEYLSVFHMPNDTQRMGLAHDDPRAWGGLLVIHLVSNTGTYEAESRNKAGAIADQFPLGLALDFGEVSAEVFNTYVRPGREVNARWETPIYIEYRGQF